jgi:hypothetical protein
MQWSEAGSLAMTALIAHRFNGTWDRVLGLKTPPMSCLTPRYAGYTQKQFKIVFSLDNPSGGGVLWPVNAVRTLRIEL